MNIKLQLVFKGKKDKIYQVQGKYEHQIKKSKMMWKIKKTKSTKVFSLMLANY
jgi:hypothetical protein